jgi:hypothetical protein
MVKNLEDISEKEVIRNWALAEAVSIRRLPYLKDILSEETYEKLDSGDIEALNEKDWIQLEAMILKSRADLFNELLRLHLQWKKALLSQDDISNLLMMKWPPFMELAGSNRLKDLVEAFERGEMPPEHHEFAANLERIKNDFSFQKMNGMPILVANTESGPYYLVEGFTRLSALLLRLKSGNLEATDIPVIVGIGNIKSWPYYSG